MKEKGMFLNINELIDVFDLIAFVELEGFIKFSESEKAIMLKLRDYLLKEDVDAKYIKAIESE